ncbi:DNA gyrase subunit A [Tistrella mobilis]|uniref:DNA gyrase subunit A n=3 Tax=Tistrella mobilis TaxID=171437 RepID=I3TKX1_TISMK|nr:DNA gyrase subunit A [Tistrella mobilis]AFK53409.1 Type IIA topoisomerase (DNA gyrase/topo II, topoisomerase IV), A subunit [Tistrella mobilis KA081020-065]
MSDTPVPPIASDIAPVTIEDEMRRSYLDYAMSVIVARALPDVRDGLKPVHRRILFSMHESGYEWNKPFRKSARVVGDVMGKYHPHGDSAIYDTMVRMAQDFSMRLRLIDGQGNFGSMDGDPPAAMRYTEARLTKAASTLLSDLDKETVDFQNNYDDTTREPTVLPARFPNLLVNGAGGIAVGMATNIPTHNLGEVIDAAIAMVNRPEITDLELLRIVPGPDFPTGGIIVGRGGSREALLTGRGSVLLRGKVEVEEIRKDRMAIIVREIPYQVNKARMIERIAEAVRERKIEGVADLRDESDRDGVRVVVELKRDATPEVVVNQLYRFTPLQTSFGVNMLALNAGKPEMMTLRDMLQAFLEFREEVITRRTIYELRKARERAHVLMGLGVAVVNLDPVVELIKASPDSASARDALMDRPWPAGDIAPYIALVGEPDRSVVDGMYRLSEAQARAILDLRLHRLTGLERERIGAELREICDKILEYLRILNDRARMLEVLREELIEVRDEFATPRRTVIEESEFDYNVEDLIEREEMVVTVTHGGYIKRVPLSTYRAQRRGGKGRSSMAVRDEDFVSQIFVLNSHAAVLFFSTAGQVYKLKVWQLPAGTPQSRGKAMVNLLPLKEGEVIATLMPLPDDPDMPEIAEVDEAAADEAAEEAAEALDAIADGDAYVMFATAKGNVRRNRLADFVNVMSNGKIAIRLGEGDRLVGVLPCNGGDDVVLASRAGKAIRFPVGAVRLFKSRTSDGVRGISLAGSDEVVSMSIIRHREVDVDTRDNYLRFANAKRRWLAQLKALETGTSAVVDGEEAAPVETGDLPGDEAELAARYGLDLETAQRLEAEEEFLLVVTTRGYGKRTSAYEYRTTNRGGSGIVNMTTGARNGHIVACFPVAQGEQIMLVTDGGQLIRTPVADIRIAGRDTMGVIVFKTAQDEKVVSAARLSETAEEDQNGAGEANGDGEAGDEGEQDATETTDLRGDEDEA